MNDMQPNGDFNNVPNFYNPNYNPRIAKKLTADVTIKDYVLLLLCFISSFVLCRIGFIGGFNLGFSVSYTILLIVSLVFSVKKAVSGKLYYIFLSLISIIFSVSFVFNDDGVIKFFGFIYLVFLTFYSLNGVSGNIKNADGGLMVIIDVLFTAVIKSAENLPVPFRSFLKSAKDGKQKSVFGVVIGVGIALPLLAVILPLLSSADFAFNGLIDSIFSDIFVVVFCVIFAVIFTPMFFSYIFALSKGESLLQKKNDFNMIYGNVQASVSNTVLGIVSGVYVMYLFSQLAYISKTFAFLLPDDFTKAEFARRGFFEMAAIVFINLVIIAVFSIITKRNSKNSLPLSVKILLTFINAFSLFFVVSAFSRMLQYIDSFGLTRLRVLTSVFMIMLFLILIVVLLRLYFTKLKYMKIIVLICAVTLMSVSFCNIDTCISRYNYSLYAEKNVEIDVDSLGLLGNASVPELIKLSESSDTAIRDSAYSYLSDFIISYYNISEDYSTITEISSGKKAFENYNLITENSKKAVTDYAASHPDFIEKVITNPNYSTYTAF